MYGAISATYSEMLKPAFEQNSSAIAIDITAAIMVGTIAVFCFQKCYLKLTKEDE